MVADDPESFADLDGHQCPAACEEPVTETEAGEAITETEGDEIITAAAEGAAEGAPEGGEAGPYGLLAGALIGGVFEIAKYEYHKHLSPPPPPPTPKPPKPPDVTPTPKMEEEHTKGARPSTKQPHQDGVARKNRDKGGEKGDKKRKEHGMYPRKPPGGKNPKGGWPPKPKPKEVEPEKPKNGEPASTGTSPVDLQQRRQPY